MTTCPKYVRIEDHFRRCCPRTDCHRSRARDLPVCDAHAIAQVVSMRGGSLAIEQARDLVRQGARADDYMADENDWIAG